MIRVTANTTNNSNKLIKRIRQRKLQLLNQFGRDHAKAGADIQKESRQASSPGRPPNVHSPRPNLESFAHKVDVENDTVISGPILVRASSVYPALPGAMERGGRVSVRKRRNGRTITRSRYIAKRPFVVPSAKRALVKFESNLKKGVT